MIPPLDQAPRLSKKNRQDRILAELRASTTIRISELAAELGVSSETIRRDLKEMGEGCRLDHPPFRPPSRRRAQGSDGHHQQLRRGHGAVPQPDHRRDLLPRSL